MGSTYIMTMNLTQCAIVHIEIVRVGEHSEEVMMMIKDQDDCDTVTNNVVTGRGTATAFTGGIYYLRVDQISKKEPNEK